VTVVRTTVVATMASMSVHRRLIHLFVMID